MTTLTDLHWPRQTARLLIRPETSADLEVTASWDLVPEVHKWLFSAPSDLEEAVASRREALGETLVGVFEGSIVARGKLSVERPRAQREVLRQAAGTQIEIGWTVDPARHGEGFGTEMAGEMVEVARALGARRVTAYCYADHVASRAIMQRIGLRHEGHFRADWLDRDGQWRDTVAYGVVLQS